MTPQEEETGTQTIPQVRVSPPYQVGFGGLFVVTNTWESDPDVLVQQKCSWGLFAVWQGTARLQSCGKRRQLCFSSCWDGKMLG